MDGDKNIHRVTPPMEVSADDAAERSEVHAHLKVGLMLQLSRAMDEKGMIKFMPKLSGSESSVNDSNMNWMTMLAVAQVEGAEGQLWRFYQHTDGALYLYNSNVYEITDAHNAIKQMGVEE